MRKGKISLDNVSGGMVTSSPLISTPSRFSRYLQNYYINAAGHIKKIPGYSPISNQVSNVKITTGIDFRKSDGTSIKLVGGLNGSNGALYKLVAGTLTGVKTDFASAAPIYLSQIGDLVVASNGSDLPVSYDGTTIGSISMPFDVAAVSFVGTGLNDLEVNVTASTGTSYDVVIDGVATSTITPTYGGSGGTNDMTVPNPLYTGGAAATFDVVVDGVTAAASEGTGLVDDFSDGQYTSNPVWTPHGVATWTAAGNYLIPSSADGNSWIDTPFTEAYGFFKFRIKCDSNTCFFHFIATSSAQIPAGYYVFLNGTTNQLILGKTNGSTTQNLITVSGVSGNAWHDVVISRSASGVFVLYVDGVNKGTVTDNTYTTNSFLNFRGFTYPAITDIYFYPNTPPAGNRDTVKYNLNGGTFVTGNQLTTLLPGLNLPGIKVKAASLTGHLNSDFYELTVDSNGTPDTFKWRLNGGAWSASLPCTAWPTYTALDSNYSVAFDSATGNTVNNIFGMQVDGAVTPDTFKWRKNAEAYTSGVPIVSGSISLKEGISVRFSHFTGHTLAGTPDSWNFAAAQDTVKYRVGTNPYTTNVPITGAFQDIISGVQFKFTSINGHTLNDQWTIPVNQSVRFGKSYTYKNRLWLIGADGQTVYYSALLLPTDFVSESAGYLDFRYVIPQADTLMDMSSLMNYIVFFFRNHIVVYAGTDPTAQGDFIIYQTINDMGLLAPGTVISVGSDIYFLTNKGIKSLNQTLTAGALNVANLSEAIDTDIIAAIDANTSGVYASAHYATLGLVMFLIGTKMFIYNYRQKAWSIMVIPSTNDVSKILSMFQTADGFVYMGGYDYLFEFDPTPDTNNFNGVAPEYRWTSGMMKVTSADSIYFNELILRLMSADAATFMLKTKAIGYDTPYEDQAAFNQQTVDVHAITKNDVVMNFARAPLFGAGKFIQLDFTHTPTNAANNDVEITGAEISGEMGQI